MAGLLLLLLLAIAALLALLALRARVDRGPVLGHGTAPVVLLLFMDGTHAGAQALLRALDQASRPELVSVGVVQSPVPGSQDMIRALRAAGRSDVVPRVRVCVVEENTTLCGRIGAGLRDLHAGEPLLVLASPAALLPRGWDDRAADLPPALVSSGLLRRGLQVALAFPVLHDMTRGVPSYRLAPVAAAPGAHPPVPAAVPIPQVMAAPAGVMQAAIAAMSATSVPDWAFPAVLAAQVHSRGHRILVCGDLIAGLSGRARQYDARGVAWSPSALRALLSPRLARLRPWPPRPAVPRRDA